MYEFGWSIGWFYYMSTIDESFDTVSQVLVEGDPRAPFTIASTQSVGEGVTFFHELLHFTLDPYLIMLGVKQWDIEYRFLSLWYDSTWDKTEV